MSKPENDIHDKIATEIDKRKIQALIDDGIIDLNELANVPIFELVQTCKCRDSQPDDNNRCDKCLSKCDERRTR